MKKSIKVDQKRKRGRPATGRDPMVSSRIPEATVAAIDEWATRNDTTRSDAIRRLVELGLKAKAW
jgi:Ribbon-helix-helix protein, copG family